MSSNWNVFILISLRCVGVRVLCWMAWFWFWFCCCCCWWWCCSLLTFIFMHTCAYVCVCAFVCGVASHWVFSSFATSLQLVAHRLWFAAFNRRTSNASLLCGSVALRLPLQMISLNYFIISATRGRAQPVSHTYRLPPPSQPRLSSLWILILSQPPGFNKFYSHTRLEICAS